MRPFRALILVATLILAPFACQSEAGEEPASTEPDTTAMTEPADAEADLEALRAAYVEAYNAHDAAAVAALYVEDGKQFPPDGPRVEGRAAIEQMLADEFAASPELAIAIETEGTRTASSGDMATAYGTLDLTGPGSDAPTSGVTYQWVASYHRVEGEWKIGGVMWNAGGPAMEGGAGPGAMDASDTLSSSP